MSTRLTESLICKSYDHDPGVTTSVDVAWVDMSQAESILVLVMSSALTGAGPDAFKLIGNSAADGSGTDVTIKTHAIGSPPDAVGDMLVLEATYDEIVAASEGGARYVSASIDVANLADEAVVTYIRKMYTAKAGQTVDVVS